MEAASRYGLAAENNVEPPPNPAATINGRSGRQQLEATRTLPIAARLANMVRAPMCWLGLAVVPDKLGCSLIVIALAPL
jgi:hypothetical protein